MIADVRGNPTASSPELDGAVASANLDGAIGDEIGPATEGTRSRVDRAIETVVDIAMLIALPVVFLLAMVALVMPL